MQRVLLSGPNRAPCVHKEYRDEAARVDKRVMRIAGLIGLILVGCGGIARVDGRDPMSPRELIDPLFEAYAEDPAQSLPINGPVKDEGHRIPVGIAASTGDADQIINILNWGTWRQRHCGLSRCGVGDRQTVYCCAAAGIGITRSHRDRDNISSSEIAAPKGVGDAALNHSSID